MVPTANIYPGTAEDQQNWGDVEILNQDLCEKEKPQIRMGMYKEANNPKTIMGYYSEGTIITWS